MEHEDGDYPDMEPIPESFKDPIGAIYKILHTRTFLAGVHISLEVIMIVLMSLILYKLW